MKTQKVDSTKKYRIAKELLEKNKYFEWLSKEEMPPKSYKDHPISSEEELKELKKTFEKIQGYSLGCYIRMKRTDYILNNTKKGENKFTFSYIATPLGQMTAVFFEERLCLLEFNERKMLESELNEIIKKHNAFFEYKETKYSKNLQKQLDEYFSGKRKEFDIPLLLIGTDFQIKVWKTLQKIPFGEVVSYQKESEMLGNPLAVRAVANANGKNKISIIVPCHRVIQKNGNIGGYGGGVDRKRYLLKEVEGVKQNL